MEKDQKKKGLISFRLSEDDAYLKDYLENPTLFKSVSEGVVKSITLCSQLLGYSSMEGNEIKHLLDCLEYSRILSLQEITDKFSAAEWNALSDALGETHVSGPWAFNKKALVFYCQEGIEMHGLVAKWKITQSELMNKVKELTAAQIDALYTYINEYREMKGRDNAKPTESDLRIIKG